MKLDKSKIKPTEQWSNPAVQAYATEECPQTEKKPCIAIATGFGGALAHRCEHLTDDGDCTFASNDEALPRAEKGHQHE